MGSFLSRVLRPINKNERHSPYDGAIDRYIFQKRPEHDRLTLRWHRFLRSSSRLESGMGRFKSCINRSLFFRCWCRIALSKANGCFNASNNFRNLWSQLGDGSEKCKKNFDIHFLSPYFGKLTMIDWNAASAAWASARLPD